MDDLRVPVSDEAGDVVKSRFANFLKNFTVEEEDVVGTQQRF